MRKLWRNYSLSLVLLALFLMTLLAHAITGWVAFVAEQAQHQSAAQFWGGDGYIWRWGEKTFENWQSEFLQLLAMVVFTAWFIHKGSAESRDSSDRVEAKIDRLVAALSKDQGSKGPPMKKT
jgi:hypothetical protein